MGAKESGSAFLAGVLAKLPEADRAAAQAIFEKPEAEAAVVLVGEGALARPDYSKNMDDLARTRQELDDKQRELSDWYTANQAALQEYLVIKPEYDKLKTAPPDPTKPTPPAEGLKRADLDRELADVIERNNRSFAGALALTTDLGLKHFAMFNEPLSTTELLADPKLGRVIDQDTGRVYGLQDAYNTKHGARVQAKQQEAEQARINKMVEDRLAEERRKNPSPMPYPLRDPSPSPLDALQNAERKPESYTVDTAVAEFDRLNQARAAV